MSTVRQHLVETHGRLAKHFASRVTSDQKRAVELRKLAGHFGKTETTEAEKDAKAILEVLADLHEQQAVEDAQMSKFHSEAAAACAKGEGIDDLSKLAPLPAGLSAVAPTAPASSLRAVPRAGQREIPGAGGMPVVDTRFEHLVKIDG